MSLKNNELLLLNALAYYAELSNKEFNDNEDKKNSYMTIENFIQSIKENRDDYETVFNGLLGYTDEDL